MDFSREFAYWSVFSYVFFFVVVVVVVVVVLFFVVFKAKLIFKYQTVEPLKNLIFSFSNIFWKYSDFFQKFRPNSIYAGNSPPPPKKMGNLTWFKQNSKLIAACHMNDARVRVLFFIT